MPFTIENIHPLFIHFPIALLSSGLFFDILHRLTYNDEFEHTAFWCLGLGIISCLFANITGLFAFLDEASITDFFKFTHGFLAWLITLIFIVLFWIRIKFQLDLQYSHRKKILYFLIYVCAVGILFYTAHLGALGEREWLI